MKIELCLPTDLSDGDALLWSHWQLSQPHLADPFLSASFARCVASVRPDARVAVLTEGSQPVAFWAHSRTKQGVAGPLAPRYSDLQGLVHGPGWQWDWRDLLDGTNASGWTFDHLPASQAAGLNAPVKLAANPKVDLTGGWSEYESWLQRNHKGMLAKNRSRLRRADREHSVALVHDDRSADALPGLMALKTAQCRRNGWADVFGPRWVRDLVEGCASTRSPDMTGVVSTVRFGDRIVAASLCLDSPRIRCLWFLAFDPEYGSYGPGTMLVLACIEAAAESGIREFSFGKGDEAFKRTFSQTADPLAAGSIRGRGAAGMIFAARHVPHNAAAATFARSPRVEAALRSYVQKFRRLRYARSPR